MEQAEKISVKNTSQASAHQVAIQRKISVGPVDDPLEREADAMADRVMRMPKPHLVQRKCAHCEEEEKKQLQRKPESSFIQRKCAHCEEEEKAQRKPLASFIQKKESFSNAQTAAGDSISSRIQSTRGGGSTMNDSTRSFMESHFGADFSDVKIHTDNNAAKLSRDLNAQAFTIGNDIYFNEGKFSPGSEEGRHLLAHELTHTLQQGNHQNIRRQVPPSPIPAAALAWTISERVLSQSGDDVHVKTDELNGMFYRRGISDAQKISAPLVRPMHHLFNFRLGSFLFDSDLILLRMGMTYEINELGIGNISFDLIETDDDAAGWEGSFDFNITPSDQQISLYVAGRYYPDVSIARLTVNYQASGWIGHTSGSFVYNIYSVPDLVILQRSSGDMEQSHRTG